MSYTHWCSNGRKIMYDSAQTATVKFAKAKKKLFVPFESFRLFSPS